MRIITGKYKGRIIKMPAGIRPTQNKVRKALFDILGDVQGLSFLELFAGSGAVGIEALSQGAEEVVFVEEDRRCVEKIKHNLSALALSRSRVLALDVSRAIRQLRQAHQIFDIIFLDPPYYKGAAYRHYVSRGLSGDPGLREEPVQLLAKKTLQTLSDYDILAANGFVITQHFRKDNLPDTLGVLSLFRQAKYGDTLLSFYKK